MQINKFLHFIFILNAINLRLRNFTDGDKKNIYLFSFVLNFFKCKNPQPGFFSLSEVFKKKRFLKLNETK